MTELARSVVLVTGAARRVGAVIARSLHEVGARVVVHYRSAAEEAERLVGAMNAQRAGSAWAVRADLLECERFPALIEQALDRFGRLDALVNNASSFFATPVGSITEADFSALIGTNLRAPLFLSQAAAPALRATGGSIVNVIDIHAERPLAGYPVYSAAKAGLAGLTRALAVELAPQLRVNGVAPGTIQWPEDGSFTDEERARILATTPLGRCGEPLDIARAVRFLIAEAPYVTGQILAVDGGRSLFV
ncbi:MAG: pteridine reductase [Rhodocyclaceae bacterium]